MPNLFGLKDVSVFVPLTDEVPPPIALS